MKLYVVSKKWCHESEGISVDIIEVDEKPKSFVVMDENNVNVRFARRLLKDDLGQMNVDCDYCIGLTLDEAVEGFRKYCNFEIEKYKKMVAQYNNYLNQLDKL